VPLHPSPGGGVDKRGHALCDRAVSITEARQANFCLEVVEQLMTVGGYPQFSRRYIEDRRGDVTVIVS